jgi:hypothetical protein
MNKIRIFNCIQAECRREKHAPGNQRQKSAAAEAAASCAAVQP